MYIGCSPKIDTNFKALLLESVNEQQSRFLCTCKTNVFHYVGVLKIIFHYSLSKWRAFQKNIGKNYLAPFARPCGLRTRYSPVDTKNGRYKNQFVHTMS